MAQYDVYENPNIAQRRGFPYLVVLQNDQLNHYSTRFAMPLSRLATTPAKLPRRLTQTVMVAGETLHLAPHLCAPLPDRLLRNPVESLRVHAAALVDAIDAVTSGA